MIDEEDICACCGDEIDSAFTRWTGPPFSKRASKQICMFCLLAIKPKRVKGDPEIEIIGTNAGDIQSLSEMISDGCEKKRATQSLKKVGAAMGLSRYAIKKKIDS